MGHESLLMKVSNFKGEYRLKVFWKGYQIDQSPLIGLLKVERVTKITTASHESQKLKQVHSLFIY